MSHGLGELEQLVLLAILRLGDDAYGITVQQEIAERGARPVSLGAVYSTLSRLEEKGFVSTRTGEPTPTRGGRRKKL
jgi:PadR family transcriptional regulator PadR